MVRFVRRRCYGPPCTSPAQKVTERIRQQRMCVVGSEREQRNFNLDVKEPVIERHGQVRTSGMSALSSH